MAKNLITKNEKVCRQWYECSYKKEGMMAQRLYPNEELLRFFGINYFGKSAKTRKKIKVLELGCGSCANLWMVAREGFDACGIDLSRSGLGLGRKMLEKWGTKAKLTVGSITKLPYAARSFDIVLDVLAAYCLPIEEFKVCLAETARVLKKGGKYFSFTLGTDSDAFTNFKPAKKIDEYTLDGIKRKTSPYFGNNFPIRFISPGQYRKLLTENGFKVVYLETVTRTYRRFREKLQYITIVGEKL